MKTLVVCAVDAERDAIAEQLPAHVDVHMLVAGVGPATAAAATSAALAGAGRPDLVLCAGIGGGFPPLGPGEVAVASSIVFADLGVTDQDRFVAISELGFGDNCYDVAAKLSVELADRVSGHLGAVLTVASVTGTAARFTELVGYYPDAVAEGMEGAGVAAAARLHRVPVAEIRAISNPVGPRQRDQWQVALALRALGRSVSAALA